MSQVCSNRSQMRLRSAVTLAMMAVMLGSGRVFAQGAGTAQAWGSNASGQLGDGTTVGRPTPGPVSGLTTVIAVSAGDSHTLALLSDGTVMAWGNNGYGQLGDGTFVSRTTPVPVSGLTGVTAVVAGDAHSLALLSDGTVMAWGENLFGTLGSGTISVDRAAARAMGEIT